MAEEKEVLSDGCKNCIDTALIAAYFALAYFLSCLILNSVIPRLIPTERTAQQFWIFGVAAIVIGGGGFAMFRVAQNPSVSLVQTRVLKGMCFVFEGLIFIGAIAIAIEAVQYTAWVGQYEATTSQSGTDVRFWVSGTLFLNGVHGNVLAAMLTA